MQFTKLEIWQRSRKLSIEVYRYSKKISDYGFRDQITRCSLSVPSNISEGIEKDYVKEKIRFLTISKGSLGEFYTQVDIGIEVGFIDRELGAKWMAESKALARMIGGLIKSLRG